jgi:hypothetical protein
MRFDLTTLNLMLAIAETRSITRGAEREQALGRALNVRVRVRGFDAIAQLVEAGLGVAVLPAVVAQRFARIFAVQPLALDEDRARRSYLLAVRTQDVLPAVVRRFVKALCPAGQDADAPQPPPPPSSATPGARQSRTRQRDRKSVV